MISAIDQKLLMTLSENPKASHKSIAHKINLADTTVSRKLKKLRDKGIYLGIIPILNYQVLDLQRLTVWFETESSTKLKKVLFKLIKPHPYTTVHALYLCGAFSEPGLIVQFSIPKDSLILFKELLFQLQNKGSISKFQYLEHTEHWISKTINVNCWNTEDQIWYNPLALPSEIPWTFENWKDEITSFKETPIRRRFKSILNELDLFDIILLRELSLDTSRKQADIIKAILHKSNPRLRLRKEEKVEMDDGKIYASEWDYLQKFSRKEKNTGEIRLSKQEVSRRLNFLLNKSKIIDELVLSIDYSKFQLFNRVAITGNCDKETASLLFGAIHHRTLPFPISVSFSNDLKKFFLNCNLPPRELTKINHWLYHDLGVTELRTMIIDNYHSIRYPLWHGNFDNEKKIWLSNKDWIIKQPLSNII